MLESKKFTEMINASRIMKRLSSKPETEESKVQIVTTLLEETTESIKEIEEKPKIEETVNVMNSTIDDQTHESLNYDKFKLIEGNRVLIPAHVRRLTDSIEKIGYIRSNPIIVNKNFDIIDGQHRFEACKALHIPIVYRIEEKMGKHIITTLNETQQQWRLKDYVHLHASNGVRFYERAEKFEDEHKLGMSNTVMILSGQIGFSFKDVRQAKEFVIYKRAEEVLDYLHYCKNYLSFWKNSKFVRSIIYVHNELSPKDLAKLKDKVSLFLLHNSQKDFLIMFENLLNKGRQYKLVLYKGN